jgi:hypothetical protein
MPLPRVFQSFQATGLRNQVQSRYNCLAFVSLQERDRLGFGRSRFACRPQDCFEIAAPPVSLTLAGISQSMCMITIAVILMRTASERFRGRVMGVRMLTVYGLPFGLMAAGSLIDQVGFVATATLYVAAGLAMLMAIALHWRADLWHVHAPANAK